MIRSVRARRAPSTKLRQAARRNIARAHMARYRTKEPRSLGRVRRKRTLRQPQLYRR